MIWHVIAMVAAPVSAPHGREGVDVEAAFVEHGAFIGRVIIRFVGDGSHVDDLLQDTFVVALKKREGFEGRSELRSWLYGIASNLCKHHIRSATRFNRFKGKLSDMQTEEVPSPDGYVRRTQGAEILNRVISALPFKQQEVFVLYELEELEGREIAGMLNVPVGTVWTRLHKARKTFEKQVAKFRAEEARA